MWLGANVVIVVATILEVCFELLLIIEEGLLLLGKSQEIVSGISQFKIELILYLQRCIF